MIFTEKLTNNFKNRIKICRFARKKKAEIFVVENWIVFKLLFTLICKVLLYTVSPDDRRDIILIIWTYRLHSTVDI